MAKKSKGIKMLVTIFKTVLYVVLLPVKFCLYLLNKILSFSAREVKELQDFVTPLCETLL